MSKGNCAEVHRLNHYYETTGKGDPLIVPHGGLGSTGMYDPILPALSADRQVTTVDLQCNGRMADIDLVDR